MAKVPLGGDMQEHPKATDQEKEIQHAGPFVTISRQYGCYGFSLGLLLMEILNDEPADSAHIWRIYQKEILSRLASETRQAAEVLERERTAKPRLFLDFFRAFKRDRVPSGYEIRNRMTTLIRNLAIEGHAIIIGQGGAGATHDLPNGLSVRLEAPLEWRVKEVAFREGHTETEARLSVRTKESERAYLEKIYQMRFPRKPAFHIVYDCSVFTLAHIAQQVVYALKMKRLI
ncbi:MAG TPA: cytidylate kinase-like family protein [Phycisphaerae bacterium]|nr:cytidylate kinase-like family protein [Phycisphaerae bacterium]